MTPKEKAISLVDSYRNILMNEDSECGEEILCTVIAKKCALIAVDELLEFENRVIEEWRNYFEGKGGSMKVERIFWEEVKYEIEKL
jgi:hypothetical protein